MNITAQKFPNPIMWENGDLFPNASQQIFGTNTRNHTIETWKIPMRVSDALSQQYWVCWRVSDTGRPTWLPVDPGNLAPSTALPTCGCSSRCFRSLFAPSSRWGEASCLLCLRRHGCIHDPTLRRSGSFITSLYVGEHAKLG